jgi:hypothetical protein
MRRGLLDLDQLGTGDAVARYARGQAHSHAFARDGERHGHAPAVHDRYTIAVRVHPDDGRVNDVPHARSLSVVSYRLSVLRTDN